MQKVTPFLWFDGCAEEAARLYVSVFKNSKLGEVTPDPDGNVMMVTFELDGVEFMALNGGPEFRFNESVSFFVHCETQAEIDEYWAALTADGGEEGRCGWLKDRFGLSWQIVPVALGQLMSGPDRAASRRVAGALFEMNKDRPRPSAGSLRGVSHHRAGVRGRRSSRLIAGWTADPRRKS